MFKLYYASAIDTCPDKALKQIEEFKKVFDSYGEEFNWEGVKNPIEVYGAGFNGSSIISPECSKEYKGVISAYDLRKIRECDILLIVTDLKQFAAGTMMELEYARNLGIYTILFITTPLDENCKICMNGFSETDRCGEEDCRVCEYNPIKNIFLETYINKIIYSMRELEVILKDLTQ